MPFFLFTFNYLIIRFKGSDILNNVIVLKDCVTYPGYKFLIS